MPRLSDSMEEGTILKWLKAVGEQVRRGEDLVEIETDKANMAYQSDSDGVLEEILAQEGDTLPVGEPIARVGAGEADGWEKVRTAAEPAAPVEAPAPAQQPVEATPAQVTPPAPADGDARLKASPIARRMARELGVDIAGIAGSGPGGRIVKADVEAAAGDVAAGDMQPAAPQPAEPQPAAPQPAEPTRAAGEVATAKGQVTVAELTKLQRTVARRMAESKATVPEFMLVTEIDMEAAVELRRQLKVLAREGEPVPSFNDLVIKACARALREHPRVNGAYRDGRFEQYSRVNVGIAVAGEDALVVPTLFDADLKSLHEIAREARALAARVRSGEITPPELAGGTFTVSNLGMYGVTSFTAIINPPQAAILAIGALAERAVVRDGELVARHTMDATLVSDHRILYGADAALFLARVRELLENPLALTI